MDALPLLQRKPSAFVLATALSLSACQTPPPPQPTQLELDMLARPLPADEYELDEECQFIAEMYTVSRVALVTWDYASPMHKAPREELEGSMRGAKARGLDLGCPRFWE